MENIADGLIFFVMLLIGISLHEFGHAFAADKLGDPLPRLQGRVTLNPLAHADPLGTFALPLVMILGGMPVLFGWGKPVQVSLPNHKTRMRDDLVSTGAGPFMNLILALLSAFIFVLASIWQIAPLIKVAYASLLINCVLMMFNMLPVPPLDGGHFLRYAVRMSHETYLKVSRYGVFIVLGAMYFTPLGGYFSDAIEAVANTFVKGSAHIISFFI